MRTRSFSGAFIASASIPWGRSKGDDDLGGYHLVWTRDMVQSATALLACGRAETARRALVYLACTQHPDGGFAQNFWIDGTPYWIGHSAGRGGLSHHAGVAAVETGRPGRLRGSSPLWSMRRRSWCAMRRSRSRRAGRRTPATRPPRWRRSSRRWCAPRTWRGRIRLRGAGEVSGGLRGLDRGAPGRMDDHRRGVLLPEVKCHYMRIRPPARARLSTTRNILPGTGPHRQPRAG